MTSMNTSLDIVQSLREQVRDCAAATRAGRGERISSGSAALDGLLPEGGFRRGILVEWLAAAGGSGACTLALHAAGEACREGGALVVLDRRRGFYPPAAEACGIDLAQMVVVRAASQRDEAWATDQALRSPGVAAVLCWPEKLDEHTFRRWQLAAESSGALGLLLRCDAVRNAPSWAEFKLLVSPRAGSSSVQVELLRCRNGLSRGVAEVEREELRVES